MPAIKRHHGHLVFDRETPPSPKREATKPQGTGPQLSFPNSPGMNAVCDKKVDERHKRQVDNWNREVDRDLELTRDALRSMGFTEAEIERAEKG